MRWKLPSSQGFNERLFGFCLCCRLFSGCMCSAGRAGLRKERGKAAREKEGITHSYTALRLKHSTRAVRAQSWTGLVGNRPARGMLEKMFVLHFPRAVLGMWMDCSSPRDKGRQSHITASLLPATGMVDTVFENPDGHAVAHTTTRAIPRPHSLETSSRLVERSRRRLEKDKRTSRQEEPAPRPVTSPTHAPSTW